jgi:hypothetical protein
MSDGHTKSQIRQQATLTLPAPPHLCLPTHILNRVWSRRPAFCFWLGLQAACQHVKQGGPRYWRGEEAHKSKQKAARRFHSQVSSTFTEGPTKERKASTCLCCARSGCAYPRGRPNRGQPLDRSVERVEGGEGAEDDLPHSRTSPLAWLSNFAVPFRINRRSVRWG